MKLHIYRNKGGMVRINYGIQTQQLDHVWGLFGCSTYFDIYLGPIALLGRLPVKLPRINWTIN